jgi:hypothetical protein
MSVIFFLILQLVPQFDPNIQIISSVQLLFGVLGPQLIPLFAAIESPTNINFCNQFQILQVYNKIIDT